MCAAIQPGRSRGKVLLMLLKHNNVDRLQEFAAVTTTVIAFPLKCKIPSAAIEDEIERLIAVLDERQAVCEDLEPEPDFEDGGDAEIGAWGDWRRLRSSRSVHGPSPSGYEGKRSDGLSNSAADATTLERRNMMGDRCARHRPTDRQ